MGAGGVSLSSICKCKNLLLTICTCVSFQICCHCLGTGAWKGLGRLSGPVHKLAEADPAGLSPPGPLVPGCVNMNFGVLGGVLGRSSGSRRGTIVVMEAPAGVLASSWEVFGSSRRALGSSLGSLEDSMGFRWPPPCMLLELFGNFLAPTPISEAPISISDCMEERNATVTNALP